MTAFSRKRSVTVWRPSISPSVYPVVILTVTRSPEGSMRRGQRAFQPNNKEDGHSCLVRIWRCIVASVFILQVLATKDADLSCVSDVDEQISEFASDLHKYSPSDFNFVKILGKGSFGKVRQLISKQCLRIS